MSPLGKKFERTRRNAEQERKEAELQRREGEAYKKADHILPKGKGRRWEVASYRALYQTDEQVGTDNYTRAWLTRSSEDEAIHIHTDEVVYNPATGQAQRATPDSAPTRVVSLYPDAVESAHVAGRDLNLEDRFLLVQSTEETLTFVGEDQASLALRRA